MTSSMQALAFCAIAVVACHAGELRGSVSVRSVTVPGWPIPADPASWARSSGGILYTSLLYGENMSTGKIVDGGVANETAQIFANLEQIIRSAGKTMDVVKSYCLLADVEANLAGFQVAYAANFEKPPLRYVQPSTLPRGASIAIQFIVASRAKIFADPWDPTRRDVSFGAISGPMVYASGFVGYDPKEPQNLVSPNPAAQLQQAAKNVQSSMELAGGSLQNATDCQMWMTNVSSGPELKSVYTDLFANGDYPALTLTRVTSMMKGAKVGLMCRAAAPGVQLKRIKASGADSETTPASLVTMAGGLAYTRSFYGTGSGDVALDTQQAMDQLCAALKAAQSSLDSAVFCQMNVADLSDVPAIDAVYRTYFDKSFPARQVVQVASPALPRNPKVSIMCIGSYV